LDAVGEGFTATCGDDEALKLIEDSAVTARHVVVMLPVDMSHRIGHDVIAVSTLGSFLHVDTLS
jgi:hypothetical protein